MNQFAVMGTIICLIVIRSVDQSICLELSLNKVNDYFDNRNGLKLIHVY